MNYFDGNTPIAKFASGCENSQLSYRDYMYYDRAYNDGYYPYGAASNAAAASVQPLKFGGKELERRGGLNWHDFKARWLANGRFTTQDPNVSSFAYKLSKDEELKTMTIIAPTREIGVDKSYKSEVRTLIKDNNGRPIGRESGWWIFIRNGKVFDSFGPKWEAKEEPSFWDKLFI